MPDWLIDWLIDSSVAFFCRSSPWLCECCIPCSSCWIVLLRGPSLNLMKMNYVGCAVWSSMHNWCLIAVWWKWIRIHTVDGIFFDVSVRIIVMDSWCDVFVFFSKHRNTLEQNRTDMCLECAFSFLPILFIFFFIFSTDASFKRQEEQIRPHFLCEWVVRVCSIRSKFTSYQS